MVLKNTRTFFLGVAIIIGFWYSLYYSKIFSPLLLPPPGLTFKSIFYLISSGEIIHDFLATIYRWITGLVLGVIGGVLLGLLMSTSKIFKEIFDFPVDFFRSLPVTALFPLFLLIFGIGNLSKIAMVFAVVFPILTINSSYGVMHSSKKRILMAKVFGANRFYVFRKIIFMESLPHILSGVRLSLSLSLVVIIISEMFIGTRFGLGQRLFDAYSTNMVIELYAFLIILGAWGYLTNKLFVLLENKMLAWKGR